MKSLYSMWYIPIADCTCISFDDKHLFHFILHLILPIFYSRHFQFSVVQIENAFVRRKHIQLISEHPLKKYKFMCGKTSDLIKSLLFCCHEFQKYHVSNVCIPILIVVMAIFKLAIWNLKIALKSEHISNKMTKRYHLIDSLILII